MKKRYLLPALALGLILTSRTQAQINMNLNTNESDVTINMDLLPILELQMTTPDQIDFVFDNITAYQRGIVRYGATVLKVSSTVDWDLAAVATSGQNEATAGGSPFWDNSLSYSSNGVKNISLSSLEIQQIPGNTASNTGTNNYNSAFLPWVSGLITSSPNSVEVGSEIGGTSVTLRNQVIDQKMIAGVVNATDAVAGDNTNAISPGTYLNNTGSNFSAANYKYTMSYRILPGLPALFPMRDGDELTTPVAGGIAAGSYAAPGVYTMEVRYILTEDQ